MLLQWSAPEYMPHSFQVSGLSGTVWHKQTGNCFDLTKQVADGFVGMQELSKGLFLVQSEMAFIAKSKASTTSFPQHSAVCNVGRFHSA